MPALVDERLMRDFFEQLDPAQLLALIEDELDAKQEQALLAKLEANPQAKAAVLRMREDRAGLRDVAEPDLPRDFLAELEPMLARPMLFESAPTRPGEYRRRHRRALRQKQWPRVAAAAVLLLALGGAIWASGGYITQGLNRLAAVFADGDEQESAERTTPVPPGADQGGLVARDETTPFAPDRGLLHHYQPDAVSLDEYALGGATDDSEDSTPVRATETPRVATSLALVVEAASADGVEQALRDVTAELGSEVAMVRNYSVRLSGRDVGITPQPLSIRPDADGGTRQPARVDDESAIEGADPSYTPMRPGQVEGDRSLCPSRDEQQHLADLGATHTFSMRNSRLNEVLGRLSGLGECSTRLSLLSDAGDEPVLAADFTVMQRLQQQRAIRRALEALRVRNDDPVVVLPVMIRQRPGD